MQPIFLINNHNIIGNSVEKCFAVWNVIQKFLLILEHNIYCFCLEHRYQLGFFCLKFLYILATNVEFTDQD